MEVAAADFQRNIGRYQDVALTQPVAVTRNGRERTVLISVEEYQRLKRRDRQVLRPEDFSEEDLAALEQTRAPESAKAFDSELPDRKSTRLNSSHQIISYAVFCLKKKKCRVFKIPCCYGLLSHVSLHMRPAA